MRALNSPAVQVVSSAFEVAARTPTLTVACRKCGRTGRLRTAWLLGKYGPHKPMLDLILALLSECPRLRSTDIYDRCEAYCPDLAALSAGGTAEVQNVEGRSRR